MKIALLYPPPWKLAAEGTPSDTSGDGPPREYRDGDLDADFFQLPYGLLALAAQARRAGHAVKVFNLSALPWTGVEALLRELSADLYGLSVWTANRRGAALVARTLKALRPRASVVVGGPHATALPRELLVHHAAIDAVCIGESDESFLELVARTERGEPLAGLAGVAVRSQGAVRLGPPRALVGDLDTLASPHDHFDSHILMTSRGCAWGCTFCGAEASWGRGFRAHSVGRVLDTLERMVPRLPVKLVQVKDDTFTTNKKRVVELCRGIRERGIRFLWSCDTRVDLLTEELVREMRLAGCERLSLGVESGSERVLASIDKKITPAEIIRATELAKRYGIRVRYYMMLGNRGESWATVEESLRFLERARPHEYLFACLSLYPGTRDFHDAVAARRLDPNVYFTDDFQELKAVFDASGKDAARIAAWFEGHRGLHTLHRDGVDECRAILGRLGEHHAAHLDLGAALYHEGNLDGAEEHVERALSLGYPAPGLALNHLACIAKARGDLDAMMTRFSEAARVDPQHPTLVHNVQLARKWFKEHGPARGLPLELAVRHEFQLLERTVQPTLPGPLPTDAAAWTSADGGATEGACGGRGQDR